MNTSSSSDIGICSAMSDGRNIASARTIRRMSFFSNPLHKRKKRNDAGDDPSVAV